MNKLALDDKYLGEVCKDCLPDNDLSEVIAGMFKACYEDGEQIAVGLAANQIGQDCRLIVVNYAGIKRAMINPLITKYRGGTARASEQCLSYGKRKAIVTRHKIVIVEYLDEQRNKQKLKARGLLARVIQHEIDHLNGISMFDREQLGITMLISPA